jgi:hypothetical protein
MKSFAFALRTLLPLFYVLGAVAPAGAAATEAPYVVKPIAEMKVRQLPAGPLYWRIENFRSVAQAKAAASTYV